jgi:hypothetical protein
MRATGALKLKKSEAAAALKNGQQKVRQQIRAEPLPKCL